MKSERGNIIVYLLVGVVLFGLLLGGLWWVKARVADKPGGSIATTEDRDKATTETEVSQDAPEQKPSEETTTEAAPSNPEPVAPAPTTPAPTPAPVTPAPTTPVLPPESQTPRTGPSPDNVAASGPLENAVGTAFGLGVLAYLGTSFARSRRATH